MSFTHLNLTLTKLKITTFQLLIFLNNSGHFKKNAVFNKKWCYKYTIHNFTER